jgi:hypothetical protein
MPILELDQRPLSQPVQPSESAATAEPSRISDDEPVRLSLPLGGSFQAIFVNVGPITPKPLPDLDD